MGKQKYVIAYCYSRWIGSAEALDGTDEKVFFYTKKEARKRRRILKQEGGYPVYKICKARLFGL